MIERIDQVAEPIVGEMYLVPTVLYPWMHFRPRPWPVLGPKHDDIEWIGFDQVHYHIDDRFLSHRHWQSLIAHARDRKLSLRVDAKGVVGVAQTAGFPLCHRHPKHPFHGHLTHPPPVWRARKLQRHTLYVFESCKFEKLAQAFEGKQARRDPTGVWVCPHRGVRLAMPAEADGSRRCPLHGLRIDSTGRVGEMLK